jgi:ankyrin repeat protein
MLQLVLLVLLLKKSDAAIWECSELQKEISGLQKNISSITEEKHKYEQFFGQCEVHLNEQINSTEALSRDLKRSETINSNLNTTLAGLTKKLEALNQTLPLLCGRIKDVCRNLLEAAKSGDVNTVKGLVRCSNDSCTADDYYRDTPLIYAAEKGHVEVVRVLLEGGANVEGVSYSGYTALHLAAGFGHQDVCRLLLDWGAKVDILDGSNSTPLHYAVQMTYYPGRENNFGGTVEHLSVVKLLLERGANVNANNSFGNTPLHKAAKNGNLSVAKLLFEKGADVSLRDYRDQTASELARSKGWKVVAQWLDSVTPK